MYDEIDIKHMYRTGFWVGVVVGFCTAFIVFLAIGIMNP